MAQSDPVVDTLTSITEVGRCILVWVQAHLYWHLAAAILIGLLARWLETRPAAFRSRWRHCRYAFIPSIALFAFFTIPLLAPLLIFFLPDAMPAIISMLSITAQVRAWSALKNCGVSRQD